MKTKILLALALLAAAFWVFGGGAVQAPDQKLVGHFDKMCKIAERGIASPEAGVKRLFAYYGSHGPEMLKEWGNLLVKIESIKDDAAHDERARVAGRRLHKALASCEQTYNRFGAAVAADPKASQLLERGTTRFSRTLELIFSGGSASGENANAMMLLPGLAGRTGLAGLPGLDGLDASLGETR